MSTFTLKQASVGRSDKAIYKLVRDNKVLVEDFLKEIKQDANLKPQLSELFAHIETLSAGKRLPKTSYRHLNASVGKGKMKYTICEVKSANLRMYLLVDGGYVIVIGGKKGDQDEDLKNFEQIVKDYTNSKK